MVRLGLYMWIPDTYVGAVFQSLIFVVWIIIWGIMHKRFRKHAIYMALVPCLIFSVVNNLQVRNILPDILKDNSFRHTEEVSLIVLILSLLINYNTFPVTILVMPSLLLTSHILLVTEKVNYYTDGRTGKVLDESEKTKYMWEYIFRVSIIIVLFMIHHYL